MYKNVTSPLKCACAFVNLISQGAADKCPSFVCPFITFLIDNPISLTFHSFFILRLSFFIILKKILNTFECCSQAEQVWHMQKRVISRQPLVMPGFCERVDLYYISLKIGNTVVSVSSKPNHFTAKIFLFPIKKPLSICQKATLKFGIQKGIHKFCMFLQSIFH